MVDAATATTRAAAAQASLLDRCRATNTCPKIFETFGSAEFNARLMTVALTGTDGKADLPLPADVRRYYFPGTTHGGDDKGGFVHSAGGAAAPACWRATRSREGADGRAGAGAGAVGRARRRTAAQQLSRAWPPAQLAPNSARRWAGLPIPARPCPTAWRSA